ncbi:MAG: glycosyltransferase [Acidobacteriota bacterium]
MPSPSVVPAAPGDTVLPRARRVLVLAPHFDDEVLGCGGLLVRLARGDEGASEARIRIAFLSDGAAGEPPEGRAALYRRRRAEASTALSVLGLDDDAIVAVEPLPDGALADHVDTLAERIGDAIAQIGPDLILVPSPLEASADHRATFAALHHRLATLRDDALDAADERLRVLAYEVNHALYPDVLVDVSSELGAIEAAMAAYASQQARHDYLKAGLGRRRFRAISLPPTVDAVEAYRSLDLDDFLTRGPAALVEHLGGAAALAPVADGPLVSVVVRTKDRPRLLAQALASLAASNYRRIELILVNDGGQLPTIPDEFPFTVRLVDLQPGQGRASAANAGIAAATGRYLAFLDDDDRIEPEHYTVLVGAVRAAGVRVAYSDAAVVVHELGENGWQETERRLTYSRDFDPEMLLVDNYLPFHTLLIDRALFGEIEPPKARARRGRGKKQKDDVASGPLDPSLPFFEDWDLLIRLAALTPFHHVPRVTCEYRQFRGGGHHVLGDRPRQRADFLRRKAEIIGRHRQRLGADELASVIDRLRAETVSAEERGRHQATRADQAEAAWHRLNGTLRAAEDRRRQLEALDERMRADLDTERAARRDHEHRADTLTRQVDALGGQVAELEAFQHEQGEALARAYDEIARLTELVRTMESSRAWRLHQMFRGKGD